MSRIIKIQVTTGRGDGDYNEEMEVPENWDEFTEKEKEEFLNDVAMSCQCCEASAWVEGEL